MDELAASIAMDADCWTGEALERTTQIIEARRRVLGDGVIGREERPSG